MATAIAVAPAVAARWVVVTLICMTSMGHAGALVDAPPPQGPGVRRVSVHDATVMEGEGDSAALVFPRVPGTAESGVKPPGRLHTLKTPEHSSLVYKMRIKYQLCTMAGVFTVFQECDYFFFCIPDRTMEGGFVQIIAVCDSGYAFDQKEKNCVLRQCLKKEDSAAALYVPPGGRPLSPSFGPSGPPGEVQSVSPPGDDPTTLQVPSWFTKEPPWFSQAPEWFKTPPVWYHSPPVCWFNTPSTFTTPNHQNTHKKGIRPGVEIGHRDIIIKNIG